jgi:2,4-dienoyl-CoA reductase-like NADH-dependent reductase (Old Yellow Enzyme family)
MADKLTHNGPVWHGSASPVELFFGKQLHEQLHEQGRAVFLQLHHVLNSVREGFQRSWAESWSFDY